MQLSHQFIQEVSPPSPGPGGKCRQVFYRDSKLIGFALRVASGGTKSYILERRIRGRVRRITLGRCDKIDFKRARAKAAKLIAEIERENAPRSIHGKLVQGGLTLYQAYQAYLAAHPGLGPASRSDYQHSIAGPLRAWHNLPVKDINAQRILNLHEAYRSRSEARFNNAMRLLRAILNYVRRNLVNKYHQPILTTNPVNILSRKNLWFPTKRRRECQLIKPKQLHAWWKGTQQIKSPSTRLFLRFLLLTGLPHRLVAGLKFEDIDFESRTILFQPHAGMAFRFPVSDYLILNIKKQIQLKPAQNVYLFPGRKKDIPIRDTRYSIRKVSIISQVRFCCRDLHETFIHYAKQTGIDQACLQSLSRLYKGESGYPAQLNIEHLRKSQENMYKEITRIMNIE